jgi:tryptophan-rich sensory protein
MNTKSILGFVMWLLITFAAAGVGAVASANAGAFYEKLSRPGWAPPASLFGPVWSVLYLLIAIAAWLVWKDAGFRGASLALSMMIVQLAANALWTWIFFAWHRGAFALVEIIVLWVLIVITMILFWRVRPVAGALFVPYLLWVTFASALTYSMWQRNPQVL